MSIKFSSSPYFSYGAPQFRNREEQLQHDLDVALDRLKALTEVPGVFAAVVEVTDKHVTFSTGPQVLSVRKPRAMEGLEPGAVIRLNANDGSNPPSIHSAIKDPPAFGSIVSVRQIVDETTIECDVKGEVRLVYYRKEIAPKNGDRVVLDLSGSVVARNLGKVDKSRAFTQETGVTWDDIGGQDEAKRQLIEAIEEPVKHKELYERYGKKPTRGILLHGPPGTGKTLLARAAATSLAHTHGARAGGFLYVKGPELLNMFLGNSEQNIRQLFSSAREHKEANGYPALIFIDEADALMGKRGLGFREGIERTIVPQFLSEMDGLEDAGAMVLLATNRPDTLDPAIVRPGRVDTKVYVRRPNKDESAKIFSLYLKNVPTTKGVSRGDLAEAGAEALFDDKHALLLLRCKDGKDCRFAMRDLASGALIAAIANNVSQRALRRERDGETPRGVTANDFRDVLRDLAIEYRSLDHSDAMRDFVEEKKLEVTSIQKVT